MASQTAESAFAGPCNLLGKSPEELRAFLESLGEPAYRGAQIYHALYAERRFDFEGMTNLPAKLRERLSRGAVIDLPRVLRKHCSDDGTIRYVLALDAAAQDSAAKDSEKTARSLTPATIETGFMPEETRQTICVSTQAGCAVDCHFCLTATLGLIRNLTAGEIIGQVLIALDDNRAALRPQTNVVLMGQGEPLLNFEPVVASIRILLDPNGMTVSPKHVTLSTSGLVPGAERFLKRAAQRNHAHQSQVSARSPARRVPPLPAAAVGAPHVRIRTARRVQ